MSRRPGSAARSSKSGCGASSARICPRGSWRAHRRCARTRRDARDRAVPDRQSGLLVNEIAPRTHTSGHYRRGAGATSQFEPLLRAVCRLSPRDPSPLRPAVMLNILDDLWPDRPPVLPQPHAQLHRCERQRALPGRETGHVRVFGDTVEQARALAEPVAAALENASAHDVGHGAYRG